MQVVFAPDSFGGWKGARQVCATVGAVLAEGGLGIRLHPMADGGEGLLDVLEAGCGVKLRTHVVRGPLGDPRRVTWGELANSGIVEVAQVVGPHLCPRPQVPMVLTTHGIGELLLHVATQVEGPLLVGLGGTGTVDGGLGAIQALGLTPLDALGRPLPVPAVAAHLPAVARLVGPPPLADRSLQLLADVHTPLREAMPTFGPQKGLKGYQVSMMRESGMHLADLLDRWRFEQGMGPVPVEARGGGAAGGLGYALAAAADGTLMAGAEHVALLTRLDVALQDADVVVLGEGRLDPSSFEGKVAQTVLQRARRRGARVAALVGQAADVPRPPYGPDRVFVAGDSPDRDTALDRAARQLGRWLADGAPAT